MKLLIAAALIAASFTAHASQQCDQLAKFKAAQDAGKIELDQVDRFNMEQANGSTVYVTSVAQAIELASPWCKLSKLPNPRLGMAAKTVAEKTNWGQPDKINRSGGSFGVHEQWVYEGKGYLYFQNGKLVSYQN